MEQLTGACIIGQSGGPTAVINASAAGAILTALKSPAITQVLAAQNGIVGVLEDRLFDCGKEPEEELKLLCNTPAAALGSCRYKLSDPEKDDTDYKRILEVFKKHDVRYFFYNGGNDSMDTCHKISRYMKRVGYDCRVMGIPKTIDNDLAQTDHCPGYGSAAKYIAVSTAEVSLDSKVYDKGSVLILEIMGRNAGWLAAASALANEIGEGPDLIYLPEVVFDIDVFVDRIKEIYRKKGNCIIAVSEGIQDKEGRYISEYGGSLAQHKDAFGHAQMGGLAATLAAIVKAETGYKTRGIEFSLLQRAGAHLASKNDVEEAYAAGAAAVEQAVKGETGKMVGFQCVRQHGYACDTVLVPLEQVANAEKKVPREWINEAGDNVTQDFIDYALPLINGEPERLYENGLPRYARLKKEFV